MGGARVRRFGGAGLLEGTKLGRGIAVIRIHIVGVEDVAVGGRGGGGALESIVAAHAQDGGGLADAAVAGGIDASSHWYGGG